MNFSATLPSPSNTARRFILVNTKMLNLLANVTSVADQGPYLSTVYQFLKFIIINTSGAYATCGCIIVLCIFATALRNLIYKVLNLAVLSVFVVAL